MCVYGLTLHSAGHSLGKGVETVGLLSVGEGHPHARCEGGVQDHSGALEPRRQVDRGHRADALAVQDDVLGADAVPGNTRANTRAWVGGWPRREKKPGFGWSFNRDDEVLLVDLLWLNYTPNDRCCSSIMSPQVYRAATALGPQSVSCQSQPLTSADSFHA